MGLAAADNGIGAKPVKDRPPKSRRGLVRARALIMIQKSEVRSQKSEVRSQKSEVRSQKSEVRSQKSEVRSQKSEVSKGKHRLSTADRKWHVDVVRPMRKTLPPAWRKGRSDF
jgi:predicted RNase H-like nuclease (RuvC/YqgF family)